jgi:hypothetical protein
MNRSFKRKLAAIAAVAVVVAGGAVAAVTATGQGAAHSRSAAASRRRLQRDGGRYLAAATSYLGVSLQQLQGDLRSGQTLAQVADATSGKSAAALIEAIVAAEKEDLAKNAANLTRRVTLAVNRPGGPGLRSYGPARGRGPGAAGAAASTVSNYLHLTRAQLRGDLRSGKTLAELADATSGKSAAGLIDALVAAKKERLAAAVAAGTLTKAQEEQRISRLSRRMTKFVNRAFPKSRVGATGATGG